MAHITSIPQPSGVALHQALHVRIILLLIRRINVTHRFPSKAPDADTPAILRFQPKLPHISSQPPPSDLLTHHILACRWGPFTKQRIKIIANVMEIPWQWANDLQPIFPVSHCISGFILFLKRIHLPPPAASGPDISP